MQAGIEDDGSRSLSPSLDRVKQDSRILCEMRRDEARKGLHLLCPLGHVSLRTERVLSSTAKDIAILRNHPLFKSLTSRQVNGTYYYCIHASVRNHPEFMACRVVCAFISIPVSHGPNRPILAIDGLVG